MMHGLLNINKATGMTSHDVVAKIRKILKQKRVGHAGTLDPAASGVLPICLGQGTRVAEYLSESGKAYEAEILFGVVTDTYDSEGTILRSASVAELTLVQIEAILPHFLGPQMQLPPLYSAIKIQGQPAYKRVRAGEEIALAPRSIAITSLKIIAWHPPHLTLAIECSKGTYIRSLAYDLGEQSGYGAHLSALIRTRSGPFLLSASTTLEQLAEATAAGTVEQYLTPFDLALQQYPALVLDASTVERVLHGNAFRYDESLPTLSNGQGQHASFPYLPAPQTDLPVPREGDGCPPPMVRVYDSSGNFLAIAQWDSEPGMWQPKKVFTECP